MNLDAHHIIKSPVLSEESTIQTDAHNKYVFRVSPHANKGQIRDAIEKVFPNVKVVSVNTMNYQGKYGRRIRGRAGRRPDWKKAVVTLRDGDSIDLL